MTILFHASPSENRASILEHGLQLRFQEDKNIPRKIAVYLLETRDQVDDYAYHSATNTSRDMDVWSVKIHDVMELEADPHLELKKDFNAWRYPHPIMPEDLAHIATCPIPDGETEPPFCQRIKSEVEALIQEARAKASSKLRIRF